MSSKSTLSKQKGVVLAFSLMILLVLTIVTVVGMRSSVLELRMARNEAERVHAFQRAESLIDLVMAQPNGYLPVSGNVGFKICDATTDAAINCNIVVPIPADFTETGVTMTLEITRMDPQVVDVQGINRAAFEVESTFDGSASGKGTVKLVQGVFRYF